MYDINLCDYEKLDNEIYDSKRITRALNDTKNGVLYIPKGIYLIDEMIEIKNCASLLLHKGAVLKAVKKMDYVIKYDATNSYPDLEESNGHLVPSKNYDSEDWNLFIKGGIIDGAGLASCLCLNSFKHFTLKDMSLRNGLNYGLKIEDVGSMWTYELIASNLYVKCTMPGLSKNEGISSNGGDSHFIDCIVVDYTIGFKLNGGGSNRLTRCHVWGGPIPPKKEGELPEMLIDSINYYINSGDTILTDCYADTGKIGYYINESTRMIGCSYYNNYTYLMDDVTIIKHDNGNLLVTNCLFRKTSPNATLYMGDKKNLISSNNIYDGFDEKI